MIRFRRLNPAGSGRDTEMRGDERFQHLVSPEADQRIGDPSLAAVRQQVKRCRFVHMDASLVVSVMAVTVAVASGVVALLSQREARKSNDLAILEALREYREIEASRRFVFRELAQRNNPALGITRLDEESRKHVVAVCHYLDHLGFLVDSSVVKREAIAGLLGESVLRCWKDLRPFIEAERRERDGEYAQYFENLAAEVLEADPKKVRSHLRRMSREAALPPTLLVDQPND
jgi:hypothetical protein